MNMSIQSDVEILSVQAVEYYAQKHHLSEAEVFDLFCKHQVFEKILIQHEKNTDTARNASSIRYDRDFSICRRNHQRKCSRTGALPRLQHRI